MKNKLKIIYIIETIASFITILLLCTLNSIEQDEVGIPTKFLPVPFVMYLVIIVSLVLEYVIGKRPYIRTGIVVLGGLTSLMCLGDSMDLAAAALIIFAIPYVIAMLIIWIKKDGLSVTTIKPLTTKTLPEGIYDKKELKVMYSFWIIYIIIVLTLVITFENLSINSLYVFITVPFAVIILFVVSTLNNSLRKILNTINKELDMNKFLELIDEALSKNIHPETYNNLLIIKANYMFAYDKEAAIKIFEMTHEPTNKRFKSFYDIVKIEYLIKTEKHDEALKEIDNLNSLQKPSIQNFYKVMATTEEMYNIEALYPETNKLKFINASSIYFKMHYYSTRGNSDKAIIYAKKMIEYAPKLKEYASEAYNILNEKE